MARGSMEGPPRPLSSRSVVSTATSVMAPQEPGARLDRRRKPLTSAPWESLAVQEFAGRIRDTSAIEAGIAPSAMMLQGPGGRTVLAALGDPEDHKVAGKTVSDMQQSGFNHDGRAAATKPAIGGRSGDSRLVQVPSGQQAPLQRTQLSFGAVYEHRDTAGKAKFVASTGVLPERQFQLDWQEQAAVKELSAQRGPGSSGHLVWVGVGSGPVGEEQMQRVREAVVDARAERLQVQKLGSEKPYSRHF